MTLRELLGDAYKEGMSLDEMETALAGKKIVDLTTGDYVSKGKLTEYEKRAKEAEQKLNARLTDEEKRDKEMAEKEEHYRQIEKTNTIYEMTSKLSGSIKDSVVAREIAELYADGKIDSAIEKQNEYYSKSRDEFEKQLKAELLKNQPSPTNGGTNPPKKFTDYTMSELNELSISNPTEFNRIMNEN